jgi:hypothetical protein
MTTSNEENDLETLKELDPDRFLERAGAVLVHKSGRGNELYLIRRWSDYYREAYFLRYSCPSTDRVYVKGIRPDIGTLRDADLAQAWSFGLTLEEYRNLAAES